jgi:hypothetical protein
MPRYTEFQNCCALAKWWAFACRMYKVPEASLMHVPSASATSIKYRVNNAKMGVRAGTPDYFLAVARGGKHGLWIEMKSADGRASPEQKAAQQMFQELGYDSCICHSTDAARSVIESYLKL